MEERFASRSRRRNAGPNLTAGRGIGSYYRHEGGAAAETRAQKRPIAREGAAAAKNRPGDQQQAYFTADSLEPALGGVRSKPQTRALRPAGKDRSIGQQLPGDRCLCRLARGVLLV